jgi:hypothetical protein
MTHEEMIQQAHDNLFAALPEEMNEKDTALIEDAFQLAVSQLGNTDIDIINSTVAPQNLVVVYILKNGGGEIGLKKFFDLLYGENAKNESHAKRLLARAKQLSFMQV